MQTPELMSIQKYASTYRTSIFSVIKKTMNGELPTVVKEENGKEVTYIVIKALSANTQHESHNIQNEESEIDYKKAYEDLNKEYLILKTKYQKMVEMLEG
ncbi:hypothetical protein [Sulfuricurvum sp.]|uniref:hypothetical protein n=1 Tax=Sulfuricurvum sp. TaxID=2025608 RepID=UPI002638E0FF|nr:hypothetical protein [Sulfuricurvum sp.]MDD2779926.1 hypothetical protein [Sulfuricurvum sp.]